MGSSLFLKSAYGVGYTLTIVKDSVAATHNSDGPNTSSSPAANTQLQVRNMQREKRELQTEHIKDLVTSFVPVAEPLSTVGAEQSFRLPFSASGLLAGLFEDMERRKKELMIAEYGISVTTLEEVFMRVGKSMHSDKSRSDAAAAAAEEGVLPVDDHASAPIAIAHPAADSTAENTRLLKTNPVDNARGKCKQATEHAFVIV